MKRALRAAFFAAGLLCLGLSHRSIPYRTKLFAIALMAASLSVSIVFFVHPAWLQAALAVFGVGLAVWLYRIPSRDRR